MIRSLTSRLAPLIVVLAVAGDTRAAIAEGTAVAAADVAQPPLTADPHQFAASCVVKIYGAGIGRSEAYGSGVILDPDGTIITTLSPMLDADLVRVTMPGGQRLFAEVLRRDPVRQLALLRVAAPSLSAPPRMVADPDALRGAPVLAASNAFRVAVGPEPVTVARGFISGSGLLDARRRLQPFPYRGPILITDLVLATPGAAGGGLFTIDGKLIGIIGRAVIDRTTNAWLSYAIPIVEVEAFLNGREPDWLPTEHATDSPAISGPGAWGFSVFCLDRERQPAYVERVAPESAARRAGLRVDDLIATVDGQPVPTCSALDEALERAAGVDVLRLTVRRGNSLQTIALRTAILEPGPQPDPDPDSSAGVVPEGQVDGD